MFPILSPAATDQWWTVGPMLHYDFGKRSKGLTLGLEFAYWRESDNASGDLGDWRRKPYSMDVGIEIGSHRTRLYTEAQTMYFAGLSAGPFMEFPNFGTSTAMGGTGLEFGAQASIWTLGADLRGRWSPSGAVLSPGLYFKVPNCVIQKCDI